jgi:hypothetical protein
VNDIQDLFGIQGNFDVVTRDELFVEANLRGAELSDRQLTTLITEHVFPYSARFGDREGVWPRVAIDLLAFLGLQRRASASMESLRQIVPVWVYIEGCRRRDVIDFDDFEQLALKSVRTARAGMMIPWLVGDLLAGSQTMSATASGREIEEVGFKLWATDGDGNPYILSELTLPINSVVKENQMIRITING